MGSALFIQDGGGGAGSPFSSDGYHATPAQ
jgi:hypothetical protein